MQLLSLLIPTFVAQRGAAYLVENLFLVLAVVVLGTVFVVISLSTGSHFIALVQQMMNAISLAVDAW